MKNYLPYPVYASRLSNFTISSLIAIVKLAETNCIDANGNFDPMLLSHPELSRTLQYIDII